MKKNKLRLVLVLFLIIGTYIVQPQVSSAETKTKYQLVKKVKKSTGSSPKIYSDKELLAIAGNEYSDGNVPLGDKKYVTDVAKKGYVYFCNVPGQLDGGAGANGPWIDGDTWNYKEKIDISGNVTWDQAKFSNKVTSDTRTLSGNGLPISHTTGIYPVSSSDPAYQYDRNPNTISSQTLLKKLPANPTYMSTPNCMGMEAGVMLSGVPLFGPFDAALRDAPAHELQDSCSGHPEKTGSYHYHSQSKCFKDESISTVLGYALDGFPITGGKVAKDKYLTTEDLDICHGITSSVVIDGKKKTTYHYVMTVDFPYSVSCFRGKPVSLQAVNNNNGQNNGGGQAGQKQMGTNNSQSTNQQGGQQGQMRTPPPEAIAACTGKSQNASCSMATPSGTMNGRCGTPPAQSQLACMPQ